jgi:Ca-activated chloride channel homolog
MGRHRSGSTSPEWTGPAPAAGGRGSRRTALWVGAAVLAVVATTSAAVALVVRDGGGGSAGAGLAGGAECERTVRVVTSSSFAPVLEAVGSELARQSDCIGLDTVAVDGRAAAARVAEREADVWIPDDASWAAITPHDLLAEEGQVGSGTVLATSPIYMVTEPATAKRVEAAGGGWLGLASLLTNPASGVRLAVRDPDGSGDGMVAAGSLAEAVWLESGMDASSAALSSALPVTRRVEGAGPALPERPGEVALVPEYALLPAIEWVGDARLLAGTDHTAVLRFAWLPTAAAVGSPERSAALQRLLAALKGSAANAAIGAARLRRPDGGAPPKASTDRLPPLKAPALKILQPHHVDHVFAAWNVKDRRSSTLLVIDVSGSMSAAAPGSRTPLIQLVQRGALAVGRLLPDESALGLWAFGSRLDPPRDYQVLLATEPLSARHRQDLSRAVSKLTTRATGTGLYDTILASYRSATATYRKGLGNQVVVFTDGRNEDDLGSINAQQLGAALRRATDEKRPVELTVVAFGSQPEVKVLEEALEPVDGYVSEVETPEEVWAAFLHAAARGVHG